MMRCFIAIDFNREVLDEIGRIQKLLGNKVFTGNMTELENIHLTLKFLGEIDDTKIEKVKERLVKIKFDKIDSRLDNIGTFNFHGNPRIVWIKVGGRGILDLQKNVDDAFEGLFKKEERFMCHMTIARVKYVKDKQAFSNAVNGIHVKPIKFIVDKFYLIKSELKPSGPIYTILKEFKTC